MTSGAPLLSIQADDRPVDTLRFTNAGNPGSPPAYQPDRLTVALDVAALRRAHPEVTSVRLELPHPWLSDRATERVLAPETTGISWTVYPEEEPAGYSVTVAVALLAMGDVVERLGLDLPLVVEVYSQFVPARDVLPWTNSVASLGDIQPRWDTFRRTYRLSLLPRAFFHGLYAAMARIDASGGGICNGMAHLALERSLDGDTAEPTIDSLLLWHGRQLADRPVLASALWFLLPSPRRAFQRFRNDLLERGVSDVCFDIAQPVPWRRDLASAMLQGHTVLPYAVRQSAPDQAEVLVYDPNDREAALHDASAMTFDLAGNSYGYPGHASLGDHSTTVFAVRQAAYRRAETAALASLANLVLYPRTLLQTRLSSRLLAGLLALISMVALAAGAGRTRRGEFPHPRPLSRARARGDEGRHGP